MMGEHEERFVKARNKYATVDEIIDILVRLSGVGKGEYLVTCNEEYYLSVKGQEYWSVDDKYKIVDTGGHL